MAINPNALRREKLQSNTGLTTAIQKIGIAASGFVIGINISHNIVPLAHELQARRDHTHLSDQTSQLASEMFSTPIKVRCLDIEPETYGGEQYSVMGYVVPFTFNLPFTDLRKRVEPKTMHLDSQICIDAVQGATELNQPGSIVPTEAYARAFGVMSHEYEHITGVLDEAAAECISLQRLEGQVQHIGFAPEVTQRVASIAVSDAREHVPQHYTSSECRPGGMLDIGVSDDYLTVY